MTQARSIELECGGRRLAALRWDTGRLPVLALHGWMDNAMSFAPLARHLTGMDLVALDFPGHGESPPRPPGARYYFDDYVFDVLAAADALGWRRFHLLGHSLGGAVATVLAAASPERVIRLAVIEALGPLTAPPDQTTDCWRRAVTITPPGRRRTHPDRETAVAARVRRGDLPPESASVLAERGLVRNDRGWQWRHDPRLIVPSAHRYTEAQVIDLLGGIECPTLCVLSEPRSAVIASVPIAPRLAAVRDLRWLEFAGGHHLHMHNAAAVAPVLRAHFEAHSSREH
ncbi:MAG: alpha/beta hydrolase [Wenzhouxiangellaceae bacterium]